MDISVSNDQVLLKKVKEAIEKNYSDSSYGVEELAHDVGISRAQLYRRLHSLNGKAANQMIKEYRLEKSLELLQMQVGTISEIAYQVGFSSPSYFNTCFSEHFGYPPGKVKRTKSLKTKRKHTITVRYLFASIVILVVITLIVLNIIPRRKRAIETKILDKSIAVLPFRSLSDDPEKQYLADGVMNAILLHLSRIKDLRVLSRTSVEQYRTTDKTATEICEELDVGYLLLGSFRKYGDQARLIVELIQSGKEDHVWADEYERDWKDIFTVESQVAQTIARELNAAISPEEKQLIEKVPTTSLTAYDFYQRGREEQEKYSIDRDDREALGRAEDFYNEALKYDSTYAQAYTGLAMVYRYKHYWETFFTENFMDSMLILADIALSFDDQLAEAYVLRGAYYRMNNKIEQAIHEYDKAIKYNPNEWLAYSHKGYLYFPYTDVVKAIENMHKAIGLHRGPFLSSMYRYLGFIYANAGFKEKGIYYVTDALKLDNDSAKHFQYLTMIESSLASFEKSVEYAEKSYAIDSTNWWIFFLLGMDYCNLGQYEKSLEYYRKLQKDTNSLDRMAFSNIIRIAHAYWLNGFEAEAESYFKKGLELHNEVVELDRIQKFESYYPLAAYYAFMGDRDKAYEYLRLYCQVQSPPYYMVKDLTYASLFDSIRDEPEFHHIVRDVEAKFQAEYERVRLWLEENDML